MIKKGFFILLTWIILGGCSNTLNLIAPYKESVSVYGLLNQDDPIHYIRIERVFLGPQNAYNMAQTADSVYFHAGELTVTLQRWINGAQVSVDNPASASMEIVLTDTLLQAADGIFNQNERVYKTNHKIYSDSQYNLIIHNNKTGAEFTSQTGLIGSFQYLPSIPGAPNALSPNYPSSYPLNIVPGNGGLVYCYYNSPVNAGVCSLTMRFFYTESAGGTVSRKYLDIGLGTNYTQQTAGGEKQEFDPSATTILNQLALSIPVSTSVIRSTDSVQLIMSAGGQALALYNEVNASSSLSQSKPNYTNIKGGVGVFSSRNQLALRRLISAVAIDTIAGSPITCKLRFTNSNGSITPCH